MMGSLGIWVVPAAVALVAISVVLAVWVVRIHNRLVRQRNQVKASWAQIEVQLKRRHDLVPGLVETVRGAASHERGTIEAVVNALGTAVAVSAGGVEQRAEAEHALGGALGRLLTLTAAYPDLEASQNFAKLQADLTGTEDKIAYARQFHNSAVQAYTNTIQSFPSSLVASLRGFETADYFEAGAGERSQVQVRF